MSPESRVVARSFLAAAPEDVWRRVVTPEGINHELMPVMRMTMPAGLDGMTIENAPRGEKLGRSWVLLGGLVPFEYDDLCLVEVDPGRRFLERSTMASMSVWQHEREVEPDPRGGAIVTDRLAFSLRGPLAKIPGADRIGRSLVAFSFRHRHRRLRAYFGG